MEDVLKLKTIPTLNCDIHAKGFVLRGQEKFTIPNCGQAHVKLCKTGLAIAPLNFVDGDVTWLLTGVGFKC